MSNPDFGVSPYEVLGVEPSASIDEIKLRYRQLVLTYHPDKNRTSYLDSEFLKDYFSQIQKAYKEILRTRRQADMPKEIIDYYDDIEQDIDFDLRNILDLDDVNDTNFTVELNDDESRAIFNEVFNQKFEKINSVFKELREDEMKSYDQYMTQEISDKKIENQAYQDMTDIKYNVPQLKENYQAQLINYEPIIKPSGISSGSGNFGLLKVDNLGTNTIGKNSIETSDLGTIFDTSQGFFDLDSEENKSLNNGTIEDRLKQLERERNQVIETKTEEELQEMWENAEKKIKQEQSVEDKKYQKEKSRYEKLWEKAQSMKRKLLGF